MRTLSLQSLLHVRIVKSSAFDFFVWLFILTRQLQRVLRGSVSVKGEVTGSIEQGLVVLVGISVDDTPADKEWLLSKSQCRVLCVGVRQVPTRTRIQFVAPGPRGLCGCAAVRLCGCAAVRLCGCAAVRLCGVCWLHDCRDRRSPASCVPFAVPKLRLWPDEDGRPWKCSVSGLNGGAGGGILLVSQFTLYGRPQGTSMDYHSAMPPEDANPFFHSFVSEMRELYHPENPDLVQEGMFGNLMKVDIVNDGPVTVMLDSRNRKNADPATAPTGGKAKRTRPTDARGKGKGEKSGKGKNAPAATGAGAGAGAGADAGSGSGAGAAAGAGAEPLAASDDVAAGAAAEGDAGAV